MKQKNYCLYYLLLSFISAIFVIVIALFGTSGISSISMYDKLVVGTLFIICCIFGISLAFYPRWYKKSIRSDIHREKEIPNVKPRKRKGHHPDCNHFNNHTINLGTKSYCAGCFGLALGSIVSIILMIIYIFGIQFSAILHLLLFFGLILVGLTYIEILLPIRHNIIHVLCNVLLIVGFFMVTVSLFELTEKLTIGLIGILFSILWLSTRIQLSNWQHSFICRYCDKDCKMY